MKKNKYLVILIAILAILIILLAFHNISLMKDIERYNSEIDSYNSEIDNYKDKVKTLENTSSDTKKYCEQLYWESYYHHVSTYDGDYEEYEYYE